MGEQRRRKALQSTSVEPRDGNRKPWVRAVLAFWISAAITLAVLLTTGKLNPILAGVTVGTMALGVWLKIRHHRQHKSPSSARASR